MYGSIIYDDFDETANVNNTEAAKAVAGMVGDAILYSTGQILRYGGTAVATFGVGCALLGTVFTDAATIRWNRHYATVERFTTQR
jgi:glycerol kinase